MYYVLIFIHVVTCLFLMAVILLQAGRGGGLTEDFGGAAQSMLGTQAPTMLKKATTIGAITFLCLSLLLAVITARRGKSLFQQMRMPMQAAPAQEAAAPAEANMPTENPFQEQ